MVHSTALLEPCVALQGVEKHYSGLLPEIDPIADMHVSEPEAVEAAQKLTKLQGKLAEEQKSVPGPPVSHHLSCNTCCTLQLLYIEKMCIKATESQRDVAKLASLKGRVAEQRIAH